MSNRKKWFACGHDQCSRVFTSEGLLERHFSTHQTYTRKIVKSDRRYKCELCPASFDNSQSLIAHIYSHTGQKPFVCDYQDCKQKFSQKASLQRHVKSLHEKPNSFKCHRCPKTFNYKGSLIQHLRMHTGEKPYSCEYCDYKSNNRGSMSFHARSWHKDKKVKESNESLPKSKNIVITEKVMVKLTPLSKEELSKLMTVRTKPVSINQTKLDTELLEDNKIFPCTICNKTFSSYQKLGGHMHVHKNQFKMQQRQSSQHVKVKPKETTKPKLGRPAKPKVKLEETAKTKVKVEDTANVKVEEPLKLKIKVQEPLKLKIKVQEPLKLKIKVQEPVKSKTKSKWEEPVKPFPCAHCEMSYTYKSYLDLHMMSHRNMETPMQIEDRKDNVDEIDEDSYSLISEDDLQETGSDNFDFESRVSDIESTDSTPDKRDSLTKELYWPTDCIENENIETVVTNNAVKSQKDNDILQFITNSSIISEPSSSKDIPVLNDTEQNSISEQPTLLVEENDLKNDKGSDMNDDNIFSIGNENILWQENENAFIKGTENTPLKRNESIPLKDNENIILQDEGNVPLNETENILLNEAEKNVLKENENIISKESENILLKENENVLLNESVETDEVGDGNTVPNPETRLSTELIKREIKNDDSFTIIDENNDFHKAIISVKIEPQDDLTCTECGKKSRDKYLLYRHMQTQHNKGEPEPSFPILKREIVDKKFVCSCKKKFVREKALHKHLAEKIDALPTHFQVNSSSEQLSINPENDELLQDSQNATEFSTPAPFSCGLCKKVYSSHDILLSHIKLIHRKGEKATDFIINRLIRRPDKVKNFRCPFCQSSFRRYGNLMRHMKGIHGSPGKKSHTENIGEELETKPPESSTELTLSEENVIFAKKSELFTNSPQSTEIISSGWSESEDNFSGVGENNYDSIPSQVSSGESSKNVKTSFSNNRFRKFDSSETTGLRKNRNSCSLCSKVYVSTHRLDLHMLKHQGENNIVKVEEDQSSRIKENQIQGNNLNGPAENIIQNNKRNGPLKTDITENIQNGLMKMIIPQKRKTSKLLICPHNHCNRKFSSQITLNYHMLIHSDVEAMKASKELPDRNQPEPKKSQSTICSICGTKFSNPYNLDRHMRNVHLRQKKSRNKPEPKIKVVCTICGKRFPQQSSLDRHMRNKFVHLPGYRRYPQEKNSNQQQQIIQETKTDAVCTICGSKFSNQFSLDRHMSNKLIHLPGYRRKRRSGFKRPRKMTHFKTTVGMVNDASRLRKRVQPKSNFKMKRLARAHGGFRQKKIPQPNYKSKQVLTYTHHDSAKLKKLADELCIPCSVYLERSLIVLV